MPNSVRVRLSKIVVTALGVGNSPILPGTLGSFVGLLLYLSVSRSLSGTLVTLGLLSALSVLCSRVALRETKEKDPSWIVIDEVLGMMISLFLIPPRVPLLVIGFALFRLLDSVKPFPVNRLEGLKGEWGVLLDDVGAGVYTNLLLHGILAFTPY